MKTLSILALLLASLTVPTFVNAATRPASGSGTALPSAASVDIDYMLAVIDRRDVQLRNISFQVTEIATNINKTSGARRPVKADHFEFKRLDDKLWMRFLTEPHSSATKPLSVKTTVNWDGYSSRMLGRPKSGTGHATGRISGEENENFVYRKITELLGIRVQVSSQGMKLSELVRYAIDHKWNVSVDVSYVDAREVLALTIRTGEHRWSAVFDPAKDFLMTRIEHAYEIGDKYNRQFEEVLDCEKVDGLWVPTRAKRITSTSAHFEDTEFQYKVSNISRNTVTDGDVAISFNPGTRVVDEILKISYTVEEGDKYSLRPLAVPESGTLRVPPANRVVDRADISAAKLYLDQPLATTSVPERFSDAAKNNLRRLATVLTVVTLIVIVGLCVRRRVRVK